jgi:hypothetical protein
MPTANSYSQQPCVLLKSTGRAAKHTHIVQYRQGDTWWWAWCGNSLTQNASPPTPTVQDGTLAEVTCQLCASRASYALDHGTGTLAPRLNDDNPPVDPELMQAEPIAYRLALAIKPALNPEVARTLLATAQHLWRERDWEILWNLAKQEELPTDVVKQLWAIARANRRNLWDSTAVSLIVSALTGRYSDIVKPHADRRLASPPYPLDR